MDQHFRQLFNWFFLLAITFRLSCITLIRAFAISSLMVSFSSKFVEKINVVYNVRFLLVPILMDVLIAKSL